MNEQINQMFVVKKPEERKKESHTLVYIHMVYLPYTNFINMQQDDDQMVTRWWTNVNNHTRFLVGICILYTDYMG